MIHLYFFGMFIIETKSINNESLSKIFILFLLPVGMLCL